MNRRGFLGRLAAVVAAPFVVSRHLVTPPPRWFDPAALAFHKDAFAIAMEPLTFVPYTMVGEVVRIRLPQRYAVLRPEWSCRVDANG